MSVRAAMFHVRPETDSSQESTAPAVIRSGFAGTLEVNTPSKPLRVVLNSPWCPSRSSPELVGTDCQQWPEDLLPAVNW